MKSVNAVRAVISGIALSALLGACGSADLEGLQAAASQGPSTDAVATPAIEGGARPVVDTLDGEAVELPGTEFAVPSPRSVGIDSLSEVEMLGASSAPRVGTVTGLRFREKGPMDGTFVSSITVSYRLGEKAHSDGDITSIAIGINSEAPYTIESLAGTAVAYWPNNGEMDGSDIGQGRRVFSLYAVPVNGLVFQVHLDGIDTEKGRDYVEALVSALGNS